MPKEYEKRVDVPKDHEKKVDEPKDREKRADAPEEEEKRSRHHHHHRSSCTTTVLTTTRTTVTPSTTSSSTSSCTRTSKMCTTTTTTTNTTTTLPTSCPTCSFVITSTITSSTTSLTTITRSGTTFTTDVIITTTSPTTFTVKKHCTSFKRCFLGCRAVQVCPSTTVVVLPTCTSCIPVQNCPACVIPVQGVAPIVTTPIQTCPACPTGTVTVFATPFMTTIVLSKNVCSTSITTITSSVHSNTSTKVVVVQPTCNNCQQANNAATYDKTFLGILVAVALVSVQIVLM